VNYLSALLGPPGRRSEDPTAAILDNHTPRSTLESGHRAVPSEGENQDYEWLPATRWRGSRFVAFACLFRLITALLIRVHKTFWAP
jgi:hypothetical protein